MLHRCENEYAAIAVIKALNPEKTQVGAQKKRRTPARRKKKDAGRRAQDAANPTPKEEKIDINKNSRQNTEKVNSSDMPTRRLDRVRGRDFPGKLALKESASRSRDVDGDVDRVSGASQLPVARCGGAGSPSGSQKTTPAGRSRSSTVRRLSRTPTCRRTPLTIR